MTVFFRRIGRSVTTVVTTLEEGGFDEYICQDLFEIVRRFGQRPDKWVSDGTINDTQLVGPIDYQSETETIVA